MENPHHKSAIFGFSVDQLSYVPIFMSIVQKSDTLFPAWMRVTAQQQIDTHFKKLTLKSLVFEQAPSYGASGIRNSI